MKFADMFHKGGVFRGPVLEPGEVPAILSRGTFRVGNPPCEPKTYVRFKREPVYVNVEYRPIKTPKTPEYIEMLDNIERIEVSERKKAEARIRGLLAKALDDIIEKQINDFFFGARRS